MMVSSSPGARRDVKLDPLEMGILWPVVYASIFSAPVLRTELHARIVGVKATEEEVARALSGPRLRDLISEGEGFVWVRSSSGKDVPAEARARAQATADLLTRHAEVLRFVKNLPGVRFAALSGGCAHGAADDGDVDVFLVTRKGSLWRTLLWSTLAAKIRGWRRVLCLNYLVDESAQGLSSHDFYAGFELITLKPLTGREGHIELLRENAWVESIFPNFVLAGIHGENRKTVEAPSVKRMPLAEVAARMIHRPYLRYRLPRTSGVELSDHVVRLHAFDHRPRLRGLFTDALQRIGMEAPPWT